MQLASDAPELTVAEMIGHFAGFYPCPRRPAEVIDLVGLTDKARSRIRTLSGGQQRRLDVALGLIGGPELLFLDEPTTGFDPEARRAFWDVIRALSGGGVTVLLTTHYLDEAAALADRVAVLRDGLIVAEGLRRPRGPGGRRGDRELARRRRHAVRADRGADPRGRRARRPLRAARSRG